VEPQRSALITPPEPMPELADDLAPTPAPLSSAELEVVEVVEVDDRIAVVDTRTPADFATLYHGEYDRLVRMAYLILGSREVAEEIVQDAFVRLHGRFTKVEAPRAYLRTSVVNGCHDVHRRLQRYRRREPALMVRDEVVDSPDELADALARLTARQRAALVLRYYEGLQEAEIAQALGVKVGTVKSLLHRGIEQLRNELQP